MEASAPGFLPLVQLYACHTLSPAWLQTLPKVVSSRRKETLSGLYSEEYVWLRVQRQHFLCPLVQWFTKGEYDYDGIWKKGKLKL